MKTPRDILLERHKSAEPKLDKIRETIVWEGRRAVVPKTRVADVAPLPAFSWREFVLSLRWHLAGLGAAWLLILLFNLNVGYAPTLASATPSTKIPSPQIILASLRENRRELLQLLQPAESRDLRPAKLFPNQRRSERHEEILIA